MPGGAKSDIKLGFWVGLGLLLAFSVITALQYMLVRAVKRNGN
jgi:predicted outer membrane lipoprotein